MRSLKNIAVILVMLLVGYAAGCGHGEVAEQPDLPTRVEANSLDGASDVLKNAAFHYVFQDRVDLNTVTPETFFLVAEEEEAVASIDKQLFSGSVCDQSKAVAAEIVCISYTECALIPVTSLSDSTRHTICISDGIQYLEGNPVVPFMATFFTASSGEIGQVPECQLMYPDVDVPTVGEVSVNRDFCADAIADAAGQYTFMVALPDGTTGVDVFYLSHLESGSTLTADWAATTADGICKVWTINDAAEYRLVMRDAIGEDAIVNTYWLKGTAECPQP